MNQRNEQKSSRQSMKYLLSVLVFLSILFFTCSEEPTSTHKKYEIEIIEPSNNFVLVQGNELIIKLRIENTTELVKVNLYHIIKTTSSEQDTSVREFFTYPFIDTASTGYNICIDSLHSELIAMATYNGGREILSNVVSGISISIIPPNSELRKYEYKGFDLDSNLVAEGLIYVNYDSTSSPKFAGRRYINYVQGDSVYEAGSGNFVSAGGLVNNEFDFILNYCDEYIFFLLDISGIWNDTLLVGDRFAYFLDGPPERIDLGTYIARRIY
jgi:hypothetical protein